MGEIYSRQKLFGDAMLYYKQALKYQVRLDSSNNNALAECYNNIGSVLLEQKYFYEALENLETALRIQNREPIDKKHLIDIYTNLGRVYASIENYEEAEKCFDKTEQFIKQAKKEIAYDALEKRLIEAHTIFHTILFKEQRDKKIKPYDYLRKYYLYADGYNNASKIYENILPLTHSKLIKIMKYRILAIYIANHSQYHTSDVAFTTLINLQPLGSHARELELLNLLGSFFVNKTLNDDDRRYDLAMQYWKNTCRPMVYLNNNNDVVNDFVFESYNIAIAYFREQEQTSQTIFNIGILFALKGDIDDAISYLTQATLNDRSDRLVCSILLGNLYVLEKNFSLALEHYSKALQFVDENNQYMKIELYLALVDCDSVNRLEILQKLENDMKEFGNDLDDDMIKLRAIIYEKIAYELIKNKQYNDSFLYANKAKTLKLKYLSNNHPDLAKSYILSGKIYAEKQNYRQALEQYEKANEIQHVNLSNDHMDIVKLKLEIGYIHCQMKKLDKLPQNCEEEEIACYSTIEYWASALKLYHFASELYEKEHNYDDAYQYEYNSILIRQCQWSEAFFAELLDQNTEKFHTIEELKQLLPTSKIQLKTILQNFYYIFTQRQVILQRTQTINNSVSNILKDSNEKVRILKSLLLSLWSNEEKQKYVNDDNVTNSISWQLLDNREAFFDEIENEFKLMLKYKASLSLDILEEKDIAQFLSIFLYDLFEYYNFGNIDEDAVENFSEDFDENTDEKVNENVDEKLKQKSFQYVENLLRKYIRYGKDCIRINNLVDAAKIFIRALELCEHFFKLTNRSTDDSSDHNTMINNFISDLRRFLPNEFNPFINVLNTNLSYYFPVDIKLRQDFQVWLILKTAILNKKYGAKDAVVKLYRDCIESIKLLKETSSSIKIAAIQYSIQSITLSETTIPDDISSIDSLLFETLMYKQTELNKKILVLNESLQCNEEQPKYIGQYLFDIGDYDGAISYWNSILEEKNKLISKIMFNMMLSSTRTVQEIYDEMKRAHNEFIQELNLIAPAYMRCALLCLKQIDVLFSREYYNFRDIQACKSNFSWTLMWAKAISIFIHGYDNDISNQCETLEMELNKRWEMFESSDRYKANVTCC
ncbi:unnamed protein product [Rotaria sp. Silwood2]|nr:unnamed protein product [Rotaria sp. Silwood2]